MCGGHNLPSLSYSAEYFPVWMKRCNTQRASCDKNAINSCCSQLHARLLSLNHACLLYRVLLLGAFCHQLQKLNDMR